MSDRWDAEANEICGAIGFNVGRTMISCALRMAFREGSREVEAMQNDRDSAVRSLSEAIRDRNRMADAADKAEAERDAAYRAIMLIERGASGPLKMVREAIPEVEAAFQAARKMGDE